MPGLVAASLLACRAADPSPPAPLVAVTFNTGAGAAGGSPAPPGFGVDQAEASDALYGNGLAWRDAIDAVAVFLAGVDPDVVAFQEIFWPGDCEAIPAEARVGFVCDGWSPGDPTVAEQVLAFGDYQIACHLGKPDKCVAVKRDIGVFRGCEGDVCLDGLDGREVPGCGSGSRIGRGVLELAEGEITVVHVHGSSGLSPGDAACRVAQVEQVFVDLDGEPAANGAVNLVLGDLNTDPSRLAQTDASAARWADFVGDGRGFAWHSPFDPPTYLGLLSIDHVASDALAGSCEVPGVTPGSAPVAPWVLFDHAPVVCSLSPR